MKGPGVRARLIPLAELSAAQRDAAARILREALADVPSAWHDVAAASGEVQSFLTDPERVGWAALDGDDVRGWIGAIRQSAYAWELHPLVVEPAHQRQGWGGMLVAGLEAAARTAGVLTVWLGTDDDFGGTSIYGADLYPDVLTKLQALRATAGHPFTFYQQLGYVVTGVFPDVDGIGKHDILMAKRI